jgi:DNA-binding transcriptional LysR family regulator
MAAKTATGTGKITLWGIEVFVAAADELSITAAARRLGASPSAVSQQLTNLEAALGTALLNRNERPMSLTRAGALFRRRAQTVLNVAARARAELAMQDPSTLTVLRLGMIEDFEADLTPRLLGDMAKELENCQFVLETGPSHRLLEKLDQRALDMVVGADMEGRGDGFEVHPILTDPFMAVVPSDAELGDDPLKALRAMPLILYTERHHMGRLIAAHLARLNLTLSHRFELDSYNAIMAMVAAGAGWTILTPLGYQHARRFQSQVRAVPLPFEAFSRRISLTARRGVLEEFPALTAARLRPLVKELVLAPTLGAMPWLADSLAVHEP